MQAPGAGLFREVQHSYEILSDKHERCVRVLNTLPSVLGLPSFSSSLLLSSLELSDTKVYEP